MPSQRGNILFLILLAVVLFAALAYAVTSSMRGGGKDAGSEKMDLYAAQIINEVGAWRGAMTRLKMVDNYKQVLFNTSAANGNGTCYSGSSVTTPCKTIGLFNDTVGVATPLLNNAFFTPAWLPNPAKWAWETTRVKVSGADIGTALPDTIVTMYGVTDDLCRAINRKIHNVDTIGTLSNSTDDPQGRGYATYGGTTFSGINVGSYPNFSLNGTYADGCMNRGGTNHANFVLEEY